MTYNLSSRQNIDFKELIFNHGYSGVRLRLRNIIVLVSTNRVVVSNRLKSESSSASRGVSLRSDAGKLRFWRKALYVASRAGPIGECPDDRLGDRVGVLVEHEVAAVEIAQLGRWQNLLDEFRGHGQEERIVSPPDDERLRLPVPEIGRPFGVVREVGREVHKQPRHESPIRRDREGIGVDRPIIRIQ